MSKAEKLAEIHEKLDRLFAEARELTARLSKVLREINEVQRQRRELMTRK